MTIPPCPPELMYRPNPPPIDCNVHQDLFRRWSAFSHWEWTPPRFDRGLMRWVAGEWNAKSFSAPERYDRRLVPPLIRRNGRLVLDWDAPMRAWANSILRMWKRDQRTWHAIPRHCPSHGSFGPWHGPERPAICHDEPLDLEPIDEPRP